MNTPPPLPGSPATPPLPLRSPAVIRAMGWVLIVIGPLMSAGMVALTYYLAPIVNAPTPPGSLPRYTGSHAMTVAAFTLFGLLFIFGLLALANGVYQARYARQSKPLLVVFALVLAAVVVAGCMVAGAGGNAPASP